MINKDSIVTAYDEHLTLVEWLQKVEKALDSAVLTNLGIAKLSDKDNAATYQVTATFADNTAIASDSFTLPSTDIVTAFNNLKTLVNGFDSRIATNRENVNSILEIIDIANDKINADALKSSINGDDDVIVEVDHDEDNEKLGIHLSPELQAKLARVLLTPSSAPSTRKVVTINTSGKQDNVDPTELPTLMENIVDSHGNKRFIEGDITLTEDNRVAINYGKWSLCGTHFMAVASLDIASGDAESALENFLILNNIPEWLLAKIISLSGSDVDVKNFNGYSTSSLSSVIFSKSFFFTKYSDNRLRILPAGFTLPQTSVNSVMRIQFDLLIDSD